MTSRTLKPNTTHFYAPTGSRQPVAVTLTEIDGQRAVFLAEDGGADPFRAFAEPRWLLDRHVAQGTDLARAARRDLIKGGLPTPAQARLAARLTAVLDDQQRLTAAQEDRVGHRVTADGQEGVIVFARQVAEAWQYTVRFRDGATATLRRDAFTDAGGTLPADTLPPAQTPPPPTLTGPGKKVHAHLVSYLKGRTQNVEQTESWLAQHHAALVVLANALGGSSLNEVFEVEQTTESPPPVETHTGLVLPDVPPPSKPAVQREYKGHPVLALTLETGKSWSFGKAKARAILANLDAIIAFVAEDDTEEGESSGESAPKETSPKV